MKNFFITLLILTVPSLGFAMPAADLKNKVNLCDLVLQTLDFAYPNTDYIIPRLASEGWVTRSTDEYQNPIIKSRIEAFAVMPDGTVNRDIRVAMSVSFTKAIKKVKIHTYYVDPHFGSMFGHLLLLKFLKQAFPKVQEISVVLQMDHNLAEYRDGRAMGFTVAEAGIHTTLAKAILGKVLFSILHDRRKMNLRPERRSFLATCG